MVVHAGGRAAGACGRLAGHQHQPLHARLAAPSGIAVGLTYGLGQAGGGAGVGAQVVLPAQAEKKGGHVDDHILSFKGFGQAASAAKIGLGHGHAFRQARRVRACPREAGDACACLQQLRQQVAAHKARAARKQHPCVRKMPGGGKIRPTGSLGASRAGLCHVCAAIRRDHASISLR